MAQAQSHGATRPTTWRFARYEGTALIVVLLLCGLTAVSMAHESLLALTNSAELAATFTTISLVIALAAFFVAMSEFVLYGLLSSLCIGLAFLVFAAAHVLLRLVPLLAGLTHEVNWAPYGWAISDSAAGSLFVAAGLLTDREILPHDRRRAISVGLFLTALLALIVTTLGYQTGGTTVARAVQTPVPLIAAIQFFTASVLFWRESKESNGQWFFWLSLSLTLAGFAEFQYGIHQYPVNVVQPGDVLRLVFFSSILLALAAEWAVNYRRLRWQTQELEGFHALMTAPVIHDAAAVVQHIERVARETVQADVHLMLVERDSGDRGDAVGATGMQPSLGTPAVAKGTAAGGAVMPASKAADHVFFGVPLRTGQRRLGMLVASRPRDHDFSAFDLRLLRAFAAQSSVLLERSLLYEETAAGAVLQERSRLAREIHDGLAQHLAFLKMRVSWLKRSAAAVSEEQLADIESVLETALIEARHAITTLRSGPKGTSTVGDIVDYIEQFRQVSGLDVGVNVADDIPDVGPKAGVELLRVVQEALNNVRKHARATEVSVEVAARGDDLAVTISDNGRGFQMNQDMQGHFGLEIMKERAESIGARLEVSSRPGAGTSVCVIVPARDVTGHTTSIGELGVAEG